MVFRHHVPLHTIHSTNEFFADRTEPTHGNSSRSRAECRLKNRWNVEHLYRFSGHKILLFSSSSTITTIFPLFSLLHHHHHRHHISIVFAPPPPPPHFNCFRSSSTTTTFLLFSILRPLVSFFSSRYSIKDCQLLSLVHFVAISRVLNSNRGFLQLLADCPVHQRQFLLKTATPQQLHAIDQVLYNILIGHIPIPEENRENKRILLLYKDALLNLARPNVPYKTKKRVLLQEGSGFIEDVY